MGKRSKNYRAKRDAALETADKISRDFDLTRDDFQRNLDEWVRDYRTKMLIKHSAAEDFEIKISVGDDFKYGDKFVWVTLECVLPDKELADVHQA